jgi:hypothetical protein
MSFALSISLFVVAGLCEIGGGYLVWLWLREEKTVRIRGGGRDLLDPVRSDSNAADGPFRAGLCSLRRHVHRALVVVGMGRGPHQAGSVRPGRCGHLPHRDGRHHVHASPDDLAEFSLGFRFNCQNYRARSPDRRAC